MLPNQRWANLFVEELFRSGLRRICIAPGSRSAPLTMAFSGLAGIQKYILYDERSAAYFALGLAIATGEPAALLTTSGTAIANLHPAIVEANQAEVPLLVLSADRPHELRDSGSNQTIDQVKFFRDHVRWFADVAPAEQDPTPVALRALRTLAARALDRCRHPLAGPVHLNFPFRKPLEPARPTETASQRRKQWTAQDAQAIRPAQTRITHGVHSPSAEMVERLANAIGTSKRGLIVCGPQTNLRVSPQSLSDLAAWSGIPLLCDGLSGMRFGSHTASEKALFITTFEWFLSEKWQEQAPAPDFVLQVGGPPTSAALQRYLENLDSVTDWIALSENGTWRYPEFRVRDLFVANPEDLVNRTLRQLKTSDRSSKLDAAWRVLFQEAQEVSRDELERQCLAHNFECGLIPDILGQLPADAGLFVANSLPVRHLDEAAPILHKSISVFANRGASGIDGNISTAAGIAAGSGMPMVALVGDLALIHDLTGLMAVSRYAGDMTVVLINNQGGGIFHRLPIASYEPEFTEFFVTPHEYPLAKAGDIFGLPQSSHTARKSFRAALKTAIRAPEPGLLEYKSDSAAYESIRRSVKKAIADRLEVLEE